MATPPIFIDRGDLKKVMGQFLSGELGWLGRFSQFGDGDSRRGGWRQVRALGSSIDFALVFPAVKILKSMTYPLFKSRALQ